MNEKKTARFNSYALATYTEKNQIYSFNAYAFESKSKNDLCCLNFTCNKYIYIYITYNQHYILLNIIISNWVKLRMTFACKIRFDNSNGGVGLNF